MEGFTCPNPHCRNRLPAFAEFVRQGEYNEIFKMFASLVRNEPNRDAFLARNEHLNFFLLVLAQCYYVHADIAREFVKNVGLWASSDAFHALGKARARGNLDSVVQYCVSVLSHSIDIEPMIGAAQALINLGPAAVEELVVILSDCDPKMQQVAVWALATVADSVAVEGLETALQDKDPTVRQIAAESLKRIALPA